MGYLLLWIEHLTVSLLFTAWLTACVARWQQSWRRGLIWIVPIGSLLLIYLLLTIGIGASNYYKPPPPIGIPHLPGFYPLAALTVCFICGVIALRRKGMRKIGLEGQAFAAAAWPRGKMFVAFCVGIALQCMTFWNLDLEASQRLSALQTEISALALSFEPAKIPDNENAALIYERAAEVLNPKEASSKEEDEWYGLLEDPPKVDPKDTKLAEFFRKKRGVIDLLHQGAKKSGCAFEHIDKEYWPPDLKEMDFQIKSMRQLSRFLGCHAYWEAANGNINSAVKDIQAMYVLSRHECEEPLMIIQMVGAALDQNATFTLKRILKIAPLSAEDLDCLKIDDAFSYQKHMQKSVRRESLIGWSFLMQFAGRKMANLQFDPQVPPFGETPPPFQSIYRVFVLPSEITALQNSYNEMYRIVSLPYYKTANEWINFEKSAREKSVYPCSMLIPLMIRSEEAALRSAAISDAAHNTAVLALAVSRHQLKDGRFPEKLDELVPNFVYLVPTDPFDGTPMKYKRTDKGVVIYSIGPDMVDDGGKPMDDDTDKRGDKKGDVTFELLERKP